MAMTNKEFLKKFFNIQRLNDMQDNDYERWVRFEDFVSKNNMTDNMKKWAGYLEKDPADPTKYKREPEPDGFFKIQDYPNIDELSDEDLKELYLACQVAFEGLHKNQDAYSDNAKVYNFINHYYSTFSAKQSTLQAYGSTEKQITELKNFLNNILIKQAASTTSADTKVAINATIYRIESIFRSSSEFRTLGIKGFVNKLNSTDYNKDNKFQELLQNVARLFNKHNQNNLEQELKDLERADPSLTNQITNLKSNNIFGYDSWFEADIDHNALADFKTKYSTIFKELYKEQKIFDAFKQHEGEDKQISAAIEKTKADMDYTNPESKDFIAPKREEELTVPQQIQKWASKTYENYFAKYSKFKGDRIYLSETSGKICKALDKANIKPTDGLKKILENEKNIKTALQNDVDGREAFGWLAETLKELQADPDTAKAFEGALKSGRQMKSLVKEIIIKAAEADDPKVTAKAKIALEVLSVIKYGNTTSKIMDAIKSDKELFNFMSNEKLSWNKNEGVKIITGAMDKTIRAAFIGVGYGATILWNTARKTGSKFDQKFMDNKKDKTGQRMKQASESWETDHLTAKTELENQKANAETSKVAQEAKRSATGISNEEDLANKEKALNKRINLKNKLESRIAPINAKLETYNSMLDMVKNYNYLEWQKGATTDPEISKKLSANQADILAQLKEYQYELDELGFTLGATFDMSTLESRINTEITTLTSDPRYQNTLRNLNTVSDRIYESQDAINKYKKATAEIEALEETIKKDEKKLGSWDEDHANVYEELMAYWDFLETGRDSHTGPLYTRRFASAENNQKRLNDPKDSKILKLYSEFRNNYRAA